MKRNNHIRKVAYFIGTCAASATFAACGGGAAAKGDAAPLVSTVDGMVFEYQLAKSESPAEDTRPLGNTKWRLESVTPGSERARDAIVFEFRPDGNLVETATDRNGTVKRDTYRYRIVGSTLVINKEDSDVNARFRLDGNSLIMDTGEYSMLLKRANDIR